MGKSETAIASIGIKIKLGELVSQINETNFALITEMLRDGSIEDENDTFNDVYDEIINSNILDGDYLDVQESLIEEFKNRGMNILYKFSDKVEHTLCAGCLFDKTLVIHIKDIAEMTRWGYDRYGRNCVTVPMDFDLSVDTEKYKDIEKKEIAFILQQYSG
jgi:DNA-directed RNA polymerase beta' subunit